MALPIIPFINGFNSYAWSSISISFLSGLALGVKSIEYNDTLAMENVYGASFYPLQRGTGKYEATGSITLLAEEAEKVMAVATLVGGRLQFIPEFDITVRYANDNLAKTVTHVLHNCRFKNNGRSPKEGDMELEHTFDLLVGTIDWLGL